MDELVHVVFEKSRYATVPPVSFFGLVAMVNVLPPAVYPVPETSLVTLYAVVVASNVALDVYSAILNA
jgi:hypothetical protein